MFRLQSDATLDVRPECGVLSVEFEGVTVDEVRNVVPTMMSVPGGRVVVRFRHDLPEVGDEDELRRFEFVLDILREDESLSASALPSERDRRAWLAATLRTSDLLTPWLNIRSGPEQNSSIRRDLPTAIRIGVDPYVFQSRGIFFSTMGEKLLGPGGYAGQDLTGFEEILSMLVHRVPVVEIKVPERDLARAVSREANGGDQFFELFEEIVSEKCSYRTD